MNLSECRQSRVKSQGIRATKALESRFPFISEESYDFRMDLRKTCDEEVSRKPNS